VTARDATELAERAGVPTAFVERLVDLGIVAAADDGTFPDADVYKVRFVRSSDLGGLSIEAIALDLRGTLDLLDLRRVGFVGFRVRANRGRERKSLRMLDFCWISRRVKRMFASEETSKTCVDLRLC
jgi:hypothetical protein